MPIEAWATASLLAELAEVDERALDHAIDRATHGSWCRALDGQRPLRLARSAAGTDPRQPVQIVSTPCRVASDGVGVSLQLPGVDTVPAVRGTGASAPRQWAAVGGGRATGGLDR